MMLTTKARGKARATPSSLFPLPPSPQNLPLFKRLGPYESETVLVRNDVGRIAFVVDGHVQMLPINYVFLTGWIYGRTAAAAYLPRKAPVAFEVEERSTREWRTVVVRGQLDMVESDQPGNKRGFFENVLSTMRRLVGAGADDQSGVLFRDQIFCIKASEISGRASLPAESRFFAS